jgi:hypothetical protein
MKLPTWTSLILEELVRADDFLSLGDLIARTGATHNQTTASIHNLSKFRAIESVVGGDGSLWWFATPDQDTRQHTHEERVREEPGTRCRKRSKPRVYTYPRE